MTFWTAQRVADLKRLNAIGGMSGGDIARVLGCRRGAVISKLDRLKIPLSTSKQFVPARKAQRYTAQKREASVKPAPGLPPKLRPDPLPLNADTWRPLPGTTPVSFAKLENDHCRWPIGKDQFSFCGCKKVVGSYCETHARMSAGTPRVTTKPVQFYNVPALGNTTLKNAEEMLNA